MICKYLLLQEQIQLNNLLKESGMKVGPGKTFQSQSMHDTVDGPLTARSYEENEEIPKQKRRRKKKLKQEISYENPVFQED